MTKRKVVTIKRKVLSVENFINHNARGTKGSNYLKLECGHTKRQKGSIKVPAFCYCIKCSNQVLESDR